ncbi:MAG TPA: MBL fold metallo-hydrolase [Methylomirabilota bacterium]|nr:MBL fold metallo-hydrolase [Methylomirabilota bacterium]
MTPARFAFLGTAGALASAARDNTSLVFEAGGAAVLVDVGGAAVHRLRQLGVDLAALTHVVVTHLHVDHAYGLPSLVRQLMLLQRTRPLAVVCRPEHVEPLRTLLGVFRLWQRADSFALTLVPIDAAATATAAVTGGLTVRTAPNEHGTMPNFAVRVDATGAGAVVYSSDTRPCETVVALARGADTLVHEATYLVRDRPPGDARHSTAAEAGEIAARAGVRRLLLTHLGPAHEDGVAAFVAEARERFGGVVEAAEDLASYYF